MLIFHGSEYIIEKPEYGKGSRFTDYGQGFYCTAHIELAKEWACTNVHGGFANKYTIDYTGLSIFDLNDDNYNILNWLAILLENRWYDTDMEIAKSSKEYILKHFLPEYKNADIIKGYRADDSYYLFVSDFINNVISIDQLATAMHLGELGEQIVIKSPKAFERLEFAGYEIAQRDEYYRKRRQRDDKANAAYRAERESEADVAGSIYIMDIIRRGWRNGDVRI